MIALRGMCLRSARASTSSSLAAASSASICSARSSHTARGFDALSLRRFGLTRIGLRAISSRSSATSRIWPSRMSVLLISPGGQPLLAHLRFSVAVHLGHRDLPQRVAVEERQQVACELPPVALDCPLGQGG